MCRIKHHNILLNNSVVQQQKIIFTFYWQFNSYSRFLNQYKRITKDWGFRLLLCLNFKISDNKTESCVNELGASIFYP